DPPPPWTRQTRYATSSSTPSTSRRRGCSSRGPSGGPSRTTAPTTRPSSTGRSPGALPAPTSARRWRAAASCPCAPTIDPHDDRAPGADTRLHPPVPAGERGAAVLPGDPAQVPPLQPVHRHRPPARPGEQGADRAAGRPDLGPEGLLGAGPPLRDPRLRHDPGRAAGDAGAGPRRDHPGQPLDLRGPPARAEPG